MAARLTFRSVGTSGAYPAWLRALRDKSGAYAIRVGSSVVYVGESHKGNLYKTITRHLQGWSRDKGFWNNMFGASGADPGFTYDRGAVAIAVRVTGAGEAFDEQNRLIKRLRPRDNTIGKPAARGFLEQLNEDVPF